MKKGINCLIAVRLLTVIAAVGNFAVGGGMAFGRTADAVFAQVPDTVPRQTPVILTEPQPGEGEFPEERPEEQPGDLPDSSYYIVAEAPVPTLLMPDYTDTAPEEIFGAESYRPDAGRVPYILRESWSGDLLFQIAALILLISYLYVISRYMTEAGQLLKLMVARKKEGRSSEDFQGVLTPFTNTMLLVSLLCIGIWAARTTDVWAAADGAVSMKLPPILAVIAVGLVFGVAAIVQEGVLKTVGRLTFSGDTVTKLLWQKRIFIVAFTIIGAPVALAAALAPQWWAALFCGLLGAVIIVMAVWFSVKVLRVFLSQKISILFWILYLCVVELMPLGIVAVATLRSVAL